MNWISDNLGLALGLAGVLLVAIGLWGYRRRSAPKLRARESKAESALDSANVSLAGVSDAQSLRTRLLQADFGPQGIEAVVAHLEKTLPGGAYSDPDRVVAAVQQYYLDLLRDCRPLDPRQAAKPVVWLMAGVNGSGKTTSTAKLAARYKQGGLQVSVGACDTFRAAAAEQLQQWGERVGFRVVTGGDRTDPASVAFNAIESAKAHGDDLVILDTAGRLQADDNLMRELEKVHRVATKALGRSPDETLLVIDVNQGQNIRSQIDLFSKILPLSGLVLTKYDGLGRGGAAIDRVRSSHLPVRAIGVGEGQADLVDPTPQWIVERIFGTLKKA